MIIDFGPNIHSHCKGGGGLYRSIVVGNCLPERLLLLIMIGQEPTKLAVLVRVGVVCTFFLPLSHSCTLSRNMTSYWHRTKTMRRYEVVSTSRRRSFDVMCPLGCLK